MGKRAVIFDFDGTLADSFEYVLGFLQSEAKNTQNFSPIEKKELREMSMKRLALHLGIPLWRLLPVYFKGRRVMRAHMKDVRAFPGIAEMLRGLHKEGYMLFVVSANSGKNIRHFLKHYELESYFTGVRGGSGLGGKASLLRQLVVRHRLPKAQTWYVGDETGDMVAAAAAGLKSIAVGWGFANPEKIRALGPTAFAASVGDIPKCIQKS